MGNESILSQRLVALFLFGWLLLGFPVLTLFDGRYIGGVPLLVLYLLAAWAGLIVLTGLAMRRIR